MEWPDRLKRWGDWSWFLAWAVASSVWCVTAAGQIGPTFDEPIYLTRGLESWRTGSHQGLMQLGTMPLPVDLDTLPLYLWERWNGTPFDPAVDMDRILPWARCGTLLFWWLLLAYGRLLGRLFEGPWAGRLAVAFLACEPCFLAHASLATTDIALTACLLGLTYHFLVNREEVWFWRIGVPALLFAAAVLAKASGLVFGPLCLFVIAGASILAKGGAWAEARADFYLLARDIFRLGVLGMILVFAYCGSDWEPQASWLKWSKTLPENAYGGAMRWLAEHVRIFSNAGEGLVRQIKHNVRGHGVYLLGQYNPRAFWYYFPVALSIKLSLPLLVLPFVIGLVCWKALLNGPFLTALALLVFSLNCRVQIGVRLVLPLVAMASIGLAIAAMRSIRLGARLGMQRTVAGVVALGLMWTATAALNVWPHALCYTNELWGGTEVGFLRLSDSNYDWGQGLPELLAWKKGEGSDELAVWYFGTDPAIKQAPLCELPLHVLPIVNGKDVVDRVGQRQLAVSTTLLHGLCVQTESYKTAVAFLHGRQPIARTTTFFIYDFREESASQHASKVEPD